MDDSCAVCADPLEWVAHGACGHRDVCSTCVARLRVICEDRRCCICKTECSAVFVTKAFGVFTSMIEDFSVLPSEPREGRVGSYWYHEDTQAFFDDVDHYRMIKAMCRLSCSVCDKEEEQQPNDGPRPRRQRFRNIEQLKGHLNHRHRLFMCLLCLEGRKVFICEQKLYTKAQLKQHINTGDSEVDGTESERGGFKGHPMCEFCKDPFYGDNELYTHMSREHFTCHICQRQHPGQYVYYRNYEDLEIHFRREHFLCEDEACLVKKFIVFQSEAELKRHNTLEHGGRMSRSKRSAALQIPTSFRYRRSYEHDNRRRVRTFHRDESDNQLSQAIQASLETGDPGGTSYDVPSSSTTQVHADADDADPLVQPFEVLTTTDSELSSRYLQALGQNSCRNTTLGESSFPPLPGAPQSSKQKTKQESKVLPNKTMAAHLQRQMNGNATVFSSAQSWQGAPSSSITFRPPLSNPPSTSRSPASGPALPANGNSTQAQPLARPPTQVQPLARPTGHGYLSAVSPGNSGNISRITHSVSAPNLSGEELLKPSVSDFPPVSASQVRKVPTGSQVHLNLEDVKAANRSLVEKMRAALGHDKDIFSSFKEISADYREGRIDTREYLGYVQQYGLSHLVLDLARLCPDPQKQKELVDMYNACLKSSAPQENGTSHSSMHSKSSNGSKKGKGIDTANSSSRDTMADSILSTVQTLQSYQRRLEEEVEVLSKDGYRSAESKTVALIDEQQLEVRGQNGPESAGDSSNQNSKGGAGGNKQKKKTSKFHRVRLGDGSMESLVDLKNSDHDPDPDPLDDKNPTGGLPARGVWRKGGGQKLFS